MNERVINYSKIKSIGVWLRSVSLELDWQSGNLATSKVC